MVDPNNFKCRADHLIMQTAILALRRQFRTLWLARYFWLFLRYFVHVKSNLKRQLHPLRSADKSGARRPRILVPLIETSHYQFYHTLAVAKALELRGAQIKVLLCDSRLDGCEIKSARAPKTDPCLECRFNMNKTVPLFNLDVSTLSDYITDADVSALRNSAAEIVKCYPQSYIYRGVDLIPIVEDSIVRYYYGDVPESGSAALNIIRKQHLVTAMIGLHASSEINEEWNPDLVFNNMQNYSTWKPYEKYFSAAGKQYITINLSTFNYNAVTVSTWNLHYSSDRYFRWCEARKNRKLNRSELEELAHFKKTRFSGNADNFQQTSVFKGAEIDLVRELKIDKSKRNIFLFSNIFWEGGINETNTLYENVVSWVLDSIELLKNEPGCHLYVKIHPGEKYNGMPSGKGIENFIRDRFKTLPENVTIIRAEDKILTYQLFPYIDVGVVFNGTLGIEMMLDQIPIIVCALAPYGTLKSATVPKSREEYRRFLTGLSEPATPNLNEVETFSYFYFIKAAIPWGLTKKVFGDDFKGFTFESLDDLLPGKSPHLDHLCNCILDAKNTVVEGWS